MQLSYQQLSNMNVMKEENNQLALLRATKTSSGCVRVDKKKMDGETGVDDAENIKAALFSFASRKANVKSSLVEKKVNATMESMSYDEDFPTLPPRPAEEKSGEKMEVQTKTGASRYHDVLGEKFG